MKLEKFRHDEDGVRVVILKLTGDVDTFQVSALGERIDQMIAMGEVRVVLDLRLALYLGSTAIGALLRARKALAAQGGELVLAHPSGAVKRTLRTAGLDDVFRSVESVDDAIEHFHGGRDVARARFDDAAPDETFAGSVPVLFRPVGDTRDPLPPNQVGRVVSLLPDGLLFRYAPDAVDGARDPVRGRLRQGARLKLKFRQPFLLKLHYFELEAVIVEVSELFADDHDAGAVTVKVRYDRIQDEDRRHLEQFCRDQDAWKAEVRS
jgi:anti-anti-sigma factor